jgi:hypothetical protein
MGTVRAAVDLTREIARIEPLLDGGDATHGMMAEQSRGAIVVYRFWVQWPNSPPTEEHDPRFRLSPLGAGQFGLAIRQTSRWEKVPFAGTLEELVEVMNTMLAHWAIEL